MYIAARRKRLPWLVLTATVFLSLISVIILQSVSAESSYSPAIGSMSILPQAAASADHDLVAGFENQFLGARDGIFGKYTLKPVTHEADNDPFIVQDVANQQSFEGHAAESADGIIWTLFDSHGRQYEIQLTKEQYHAIVDSRLKPMNTASLETENGKTITVRDYTKYVQAGSFNRIADQIYGNTGSNYQFIYETWYVAAHATSYAKEDVEQVSLPLETLYAAKGDCEDLTILIASMVKASSFTKDWDIKIVYFDASSPEHSGKVNHVALYVDTGKETMFVESTADSNGLTIWNKVEGWYIDV